jgi:hypothetical protein
MNFTPERAAVQEALNFGEPNLPVDPDSIQVLQTQVQEERSLMLVTFQRGRGMAMPDECLAVYEARRYALGWSVSGGGTGCGPVGGSGAPLDVGSGAKSSPESSSSHAMGFVRDPSITSVEVTWDDGQVQKVPVVNGSYLAWREGLATPAQVLGLDSQDQVIYTSASLLIAPGKEGP